ncbi:MAG: glycosyltransferase [Anaerolineae bacterium]|nr:glycosyltransferase [Anaerolineae bacterium]
MPLLRIAMLAPFAVHGPKGTTRWRVMPLARALAAAGHAVRVVVPPYDNPVEGGKRWTDGGVEVVNVAAPRGGSRSGALSLVSGLERAAAGWQPDVVHSFKPKGYNGLAAHWLALRGWLVVQDSDDWEAGWNAVAGYSCSWQRLFSWQERRGLAGAAAVTVASRWLERLAVRLRGSDTGVFYLPNGVAGDRFNSGSRSHNAILSSPHAQTVDEPQVLLYSRFGETSPAVVWRVWSTVLAAFPAARLVVVGAGDAGEEATLRDLAAAAGAARSVVTLGWQQPETLPGLLASSDVAVFPVTDIPLNRAKSPMRLLDVLAAGVPVAAQAVGDYACYVADGETGLLAPAGDPEALAGAVVRLLADRRLARRLGDEAARRAAIDHAWPRLAETSIAAYRFARSRHSRAGGNPHLADRECDNEKIIR